MNLAPRILEKEFSIGLVQSYDQLYKDTLNFIFQKLDKIKGIKNQGESFVLFLRIVSKIV